MIEKDDIEISQDYVGNNRYQITAALHQEAWGYTLKEDLKEVGEKIELRLHNEIVSYLYADIIEDLECLSALILCLNDPVAVDVNDTLMETVHNIRGLFK
jgi:hypothetical protein